MRFLGRKRGKKIKAATEWHRYTASPGASVFGIADIKALPRIASLFMV
jgi:hypothetical protein